MSLSQPKLKIPGVKSIIGVVSGKGGLGKTFFTANLGVTLAKMGRSVGILDADVTYPNLWKTMGITAKVTPTSENKLTPVDKWGVKMMSMAGLCSAEDEPMMYRGPIISRIIQQLLKETIWGDLDVLLIDFPSGTSDATQTILQTFVVDGVIAITSPPGLALMDTRRALNGLEYLKIPILGIVENLRGDIFGEGGGNRLADMYRTSLLASIPMRKQIVTLMNQGLPAALHMEELEMIFVRIARYLEESVITSNDA